MAYSFECGVCHSTYRLDDSQITPKGVKVTCPKCMNFIILKREDLASAQEAIIEHIVSEGEVDQTLPGSQESPFSIKELLSESDESTDSTEEPPSVSSHPIETPSTETASKSVSSVPPLMKEEGFKNNEPSKTQTPSSLSAKPSGSSLSGARYSLVAEQSTRASSSEDSLKPQSPKPRPSAKPRNIVEKNSAQRSMEKLAAFPSLVLTTGARKIAAAMLDLPEEEVSKHHLDRYFYWGAGVIITVLLFLILNFFHLVRIPGLESLRRVKPTIIIQEQQNPEPGSEKLKHGLPVIDPNFDSWEEKKK